MLDVWRQSDAPSAKGRIANGRQPEMVWLRYAQYIYGCEDEEQAARDGAGALCPADGWV